MKQGKAAVVPKTPGGEKTPRVPRSPSANRHIMKKSETVKTLLKALSDPLFLQDVVYIDGVELPPVELSEIVQSIREAISSASASEEATLAIEDADISSAIAELTALVETRNAQHLQLLEKKFGRPSPRKQRWSPRKMR